MESFERARRDAFFTKIVSRFASDEQATTFLITHLLPERPGFVRAVAATSRLRAVLPKPKSIDPAARREVEQSIPVDALSRDLFSATGTALDYFETRARGERIMLLDIGGYFAPTLAHLHGHFSGQLVGVVEDTENGHRRYADLEKLPCPVVSVARSPLKEPEDFLIGQSVVFSAEAVMRGRGDILHGRPALVIGFGKLGSSIARLLHAKGVLVTVYDVDPVRRTQALAQGFTVARDRERALNDAGLVLCATGAISLRGEDFPHLRNGAYVATVTSSEDELELTGLPAVYTRAKVSEHVDRYQTTGHYFYLANSGNAVNFLHGASVGPFIYLVQAEIIAGISMLTRGALPSGIHEVSGADRAAIAAIWLNYFNR
ncbi:MULTISPECIES: NAD(P)-binding domain-containing protein [Protofrankia]|uniref:Adenosylhomocysteinase n=1 Tax=Protofrankia coriariae TaxID=1562887 RepID=A0ABR5F541_9ACTN|nr:MULTISPECIES: NAD(P)-binding domain-containing protein [Protofrankia]KLL11852.1 adenosylhomocysteinase [Protofrankia coriariae]ONH34265.1 adenosylhomocysteinase [Protofrankia sp. BMG5.30]